MPTIPSMINTSSPITIQPCNAVMFSSFTNASSCLMLKNAPCCSIKRLEGDFVTAILFQWVFGFVRVQWESHDTGQRRSHLPILLPRGPRNTSRTSQTAMKHVSPHSINIVGAHNMPAQICEQFSDFGKNAFS